jgi:DNA polymerase-3 subunit epsilon
MQKIELPAKYYLDHFLEMLETLKGAHSFLFEESHKTFLQKFDSLSEDAKCLFIRIANRKGVLFDKASFEFTNWDELAAVGLIRPATLEDETHFSAWVKKEQIKKILDQHQVSYKKSASKDILLEIFQENRAKLVHLENEFTPLIINHAYGDLHYLLFLLFGKVQDSLILYTLRDLGIRKAHSKKVVKAKFKTIEEAKSLYFYSTLTATPETWPPAIGEEAKLKKEKVLLKAADEARQNDQLLEALSLYQMCENYPATEKRARLLWELDKKDECLLALQKMMDDPSHDEELLFAEDFMGRKFGAKKLSLLTETLRSARHLDIDDSFYRHPEFGVVEYYKKKNCQAHFSENFLFSALFGMVFHDQLISMERHSEFDRVPKALKNKLSFESLDQFSWEEALERNYSDSDFFILDEDSKAMMKDFVTTADQKSLEHMLGYLNGDYWSRHTGFPDLFIIEDGEIKFIEIKAEGDSLKKSQLKQMRELEKAGFKVEVLNVSYKYNPDQVYVVVDIETTGHLSSWNRITEVAAVKMQGDKVIDRFQSLVNPRRSIPRDIQQLTGISNEMVSSAPGFEEIADSLDEFTKDAIFVAHNVSFDYAFIQKEFDRIEKRFVRPYICTKAGIKKHYPKLESYSLKNLSSHFAISLKQHHRAMSDAEAASDLLRLINLKRAQV